MKKFSEENIHDFSNKLKQAPAIASLRQYIVWQRAYRLGRTGPPGSGLSFPKFGPVFINLDLTTACNYRCPYCVDKSILNSARPFTFSQVCRIVDNLCQHGLKAVLLIGGGEPALHKDFTSVVRYLKKKGLQVGIVTNGSFMDKIVEVSKYLRAPDWIRVSLDAASNELFQEIHRPNIKIKLTDICNKMNEIKNINPAVIIGGSYTIIWKGIKINGIKLPENIAQIPGAVKLGIAHQFDYLSFKPCLLKNGAGGIESLLHCETDEFASSVSKRIKNALKEAGKLAKGKIRVVATLNLQAVLEGDFREFKKQPRYCHIQLFRAVVSPAGIFHCPAFRGDKRAQIGEACGFLNEKKFIGLIANNYNNLVNFNACQTCKNVVCFYNRVNHWIEEFIQSNQDPKDIPECQGHNFFL